MKIRSGFVSNSSSSSFIVGFRRKPKTVEELHELLFLGKPMEETMSYYNGDVFGLGQISNRIFKDVKKKAKKSEIIEEFESLMHYSDEFDSKELNEIKQQYDELYNDHEDKKKSNNYGIRLKNRLTEKYFKEIESNMWGPKISVSKTFLKKLVKDNTTFLLHFKSNDALVRSICSGIYNKKIDESVIDDLYTYIKLKKIEQKACHTRWHKIHILGKKFGAVYYDKFKQENSNLWVTVLNYGDESSTLDGMIEHGNIFNNLPLHITISHH